MTCRRRRPRLPETTFLRGSSVSSSRLAPRSSELWRGRDGSARWRSSSAACPRPVRSVEHRERPAGDVDQQVEQAQRWGGTVTDEQYADVRKDGAVQPVFSVPAAILIFVPIVSFAISGILLRRLQCAARRQRHATSRCSPSMRTRGAVSCSRRAVHAAAELSARIDVEPDQPRRLRAGVPRRHQLHRAVSWHDRSVHRLVADCKRHRAGGAVSSAGRRQSSGR